MTKIYSAPWLLPISSSPIQDGALAVECDQIAAHGSLQAMREQFPEAEVREFSEAAIVPGLINTHTHLELTAMRGFLDAEEAHFPAWLRKLTIARLERLTPEDLYISSVWGACEAARAGITCVGDSSDSANESIRALKDVGLRGTVFQESFGPDPKLSAENFRKLTEKVARLREVETDLVRAGVSPHAPYTVCASQLQRISEFAISERLPLMMHAAESRAEEMLVRDGRGPFAESLRKRGIEWSAPGVSTIRYLSRNRILETAPLLAHCINVDDDDLALLKEAKASVAHCPRSNAKLGHGRAPFARFLRQKISVGLGSDSVASNNSCDILSEARFAVLLSRSDWEAEGSSPGTTAELLGASEALHAATLGGAEALSLRGLTGELRKGLAADFAVVSLSGTHQFPSYDPISTLVFASSGHDVLMTVVGGKEIYAEGAIKTIDEDRLRARMREIAGKLM